MFISSDKAFHYVGLVYLFNGISTLYGLFNAEIWLISKYMIIIIIIYIWFCLNFIF